MNGVTNPPCSKTKNDDASAEQKKIYTSDKK
jgi:hypothetical protein